MTANPTIEKRNLANILSQANPEHLIVRNAISGEILLTSDSALPVNIIIRADGTEYDLLQFAPITDWRNSQSLLTATDNGWLFVTASTTPGANPLPSETECCGIEPPANPQTGDLLIWSGAAWSRFAPGTTGFVLTSAGADALPTWTSGGGGGLPPLSGDQRSVLFEGSGSRVFRRITSADIVPDFAISSFSIAGGSLPTGLTNTVERGTLITPLFNATCNRGPTIATMVDDENGPPPVNVLGSFVGATGTNIPGQTAQRLTPGATFQTTTYTLAASDGVTSATATETFTWMRRVYFGVLNHAGPYTMSEIQSLTNPLATTRSRSFNVTAGVGQYVVYAYLAALGTATFSVGGFAGGFSEVQPSLSVATENSALVGATVVTEPYAVWQSDNTNLGSITVVVS